MAMNYREKLNEMRDESLSTQKAFLVVIAEIRFIATKGEALPEELIYRREQLYAQFNKLIKLHRRISNYCDQHAIGMMDEFPEDTSIF